MNTEWEQLRHARLDVNIRSGSGGVPVLDLRGSLDVATRNMLKAAMSDLLQRAASHVVVNMTDVVFVDSSGLEVLVSGSRRMREIGGRLSIVTGGRHIQRIFDVTRLGEVVAIYATEAEALDG